MNKKIFQSDTVFNEILTKIFDLVWLNVLWLICCLPVITVGASTAALYYVSGKMVRKEGYSVTRDFFHGFRQNLKQSIGITLFGLLAVGILVFDFHVLGQQTSAVASLAYGGCIILAIGLAAVFGFVFPMLARYENGTKTLFHNAAAMAGSHFAEAAKILLINGVPVILFLVFPTILYHVFPVWMVVGVSIAAYLDSIILMPLFNRLEENSEEVDEEADEEADEELPKS